MSKALAKVRAMITVNKTIAKLGGNLIGTHPAGSAEWHAQRAHSIGGSDIAPIMNNPPGLARCHYGRRSQGSYFPQRVLWL